MPLNIYDLINSKMQKLAFNDLEMKFDLELIIQFYFQFVLNVRRIISESLHTPIKQLVDFKANLKLDYTPINLFRAINDHTSLLFTWLLFLQKLKVQKQMMLNSFIPIPE